MQVFLTFLIAAAVAVLGFVTCYIAYVRPLRRQVDALSADLAAETSIETEREKDYEVAVAGFSRQLTELKSVIATLERQVAGARDSGGLTSEIGRFRDDVLTAAAQGGPSPNGNDARGKHDVAVTAVRMLISWKTSAEHDPGQGGGTGRGRGHPGSADSGRLVARLEARRLEPRELGSLGPVLERYQEYLASGYNAEGLKDSVFSVVADRLTRPFDTALSREFVVPAVTGPASAGPDLEAAANFVTRLAESPLEAAERVVGIADPGSLGAVVGADFIVAPVVRPVSQAAFFCEVAGFAIGALTGFYPLMAACGKPLLHREIAAAFKEGLTQVFGADHGDREIAMDRTRAREAREAAADRTTRRETTERASETDGQLTRPRRPLALDAPGREHYVPPEAPIREPHWTPWRTEAPGTRAGADRDEPASRRDDDRDRFEGPSRGGR